jgi:Beta/Gamma crystallin
MVLRLALAVVIAASLFSLDASAQRRGWGYAGITVYEHPDFRGDSVTFRDEIADLRAHGLNDRITSIEIDGNQAWEVCRDVNFNGGCRVFSGTIDDLRQEGWNDRISSLRPAGAARGGWGGNGGWGNNRNRDVRNRSNRAQSRLVLFDRANYRGDSRDIVNNATNLGSIGDSARSVQVYGGTWELCEGVFRNARCVTVRENVPDLRSLGLRNGITSAREVANQSRGRWPF